MQVIFLTSYIASVLTGKEEISVSALLANKKFKIAN